MKKLQYFMFGCYAVFLIVLTACGQVEPNVSVYESTRSGIAFQYPSKMMLVEEADQVSLRHALPLIHQDPCDFQGGKPDLTQLTDFHVTMKMYPFDVAGTVAATQHSSFLQDYFPNNQFKLSEGYIREYTQGTLQGHEVTQGVEGCGYYLYYFPLESSKTLVVKRLFITELSPISGNKDEYLALPGVIKPEEEIAIFEQILRDFDYRKP